MNGCPLDWPSRNEVKRKSTETKPIRISSPPTTQRRRRSPGSNGGAAPANPPSRIARAADEFNRTRRRQRSSPRKAVPLPLPLRHGWMPAAEASSLARRAPKRHPGPSRLEDVFTDSLEVQTLLIFPYSNLMSPLSSESENPPSSVFLRAARGRLRRQITFFLFCSKVLLHFRFLSGPHLPAACVLSAVKGGDRRPQTVKLGCNLTERIRMSHLLTERFIYDGQIE
jgi:hypothetical protein